MVKQQFIEKLSKASVVNIDGSFATDFHLNDQGEFVIDWWVEKNKTFTRRYYLNDLDVRVTWDGSWYCLEDHNYTTNIRFLQYF